MFALMAPGQGAQTPGMLAPWLRDPGCAELVRAWSQAADCDLVHLGTKASAAEIARTENTQPLLVAQGLLALEVLAEVHPAEQVVAAGHSVGELTAAAYAGVLTPEDAVRLAVIRGRAMALACDQVPTSMTAVVGGDEQEVLAHLAALDLTPATYNGAGQIVAAGHVRDLERLAATPPPGAALRPLPVAGAFHTRYMDSARRTFEEAVATVPFADPARLLLSNADGNVVTSAQDVRRRLVDQLMLPVRWDLCLATLDRLSPELTVAVPPAKTLTNVLRRQLPHLEVLAVTTPRDLAPIRRRLSAEQGGLIRVGA